MMENNIIANKNMHRAANVALLEDTFLTDAVNLFPNSTILINCEKHKSPAVFYSKQ